MANLDPSLTFSYTYLWQNHLLTNLTKKRLPKGSFFNNMSYLVFAAKSKLLKISLVDLLIPEVHCTMNTSFK